jgi:predicted nuclease of predicted toxin-antitoxin system
MLFLIDEDVPVTVGLFLRERGHEVRFVAEEFGKGTADIVIVAGGDGAGAVVITHNRKHFEALVRRVPVGNRRRFRRVGLICLTCSQPRALQRLQKEIDLIEFQYERLSRIGGRLIATVTNTTINFID